MNDHYASEDPSGYLFHVVRLFFGSLCPGCAHKTVWSMVLQNSMKHIKVLTISSSFLCQRVVHCYKYMENSLEVLENELADICFYAGSLKG